MVVSRSDCVCFRSKIDVTIATLSLTHLQPLPPHPDHGEDLLHVVSCMLFDDGNDLGQLLEHVLPHVATAAADSMQKWRHHLVSGGGGEE